LKNLREINIDKDVKWGGSKITKIKIARSSKIKKCHGIERNLGHDFLDANYGNRR